MAGAILEINIDSKMRAHITQIIEEHMSQKTQTDNLEPPKTLFDSAQESIFHLMTSDPFQRFLKSPQPDIKRIKESGSIVNWWQKEKKANSVTFMIFFRTDEADVFTRKYLHEWNLLVDGIKNRNGVFYAITSSEQLEADAAKIGWDLKFTAISDVTNELANHLGLQIRPHPNFAEYGTVELAVVIVTPKKTNL